VIERHVLSVGLLALISGLTWFGLFAPIDDALTDWRFGLYSRAPSDSVVVVEIDPDSLAEIQPWPWSRSVYANVVRNLQGAGARTIGIDVDFSSRSDAAGDLAFKDALAARPGDVVLSSFVQPRSLSANGALRTTSPHAYFLEHAAVASVNLVVEPSGFARRGWYGADAPDGYRASFAASIAGFPPTRDGSFHIDFSIDARRLVRLPIADVATGRFDPSKVAGRNVLIGATALELGDEYSAPVYGLLPGVILHALSYESLVQGRALYRVHGIFVLPLVAVLLVFLRRPRDGWTWGRFALRHATIGLGALALSVVLQLAAPISFDLTPLLAAQLVCVGITTLRELERRAREVIRHQLDAARHQALIALVVRDSSDGVIITEQSGTIVVLNERAAKLLNLDQVDHAGRLLTDLVPDFPVYGKESGRQGAPRLSQDCLSMVSEYVAPDGDGTRILEIMADWTGYGDRRDASGIEVRKVFAYSLRDVTARKRTERAEREAKHAAIAASKAKDHLIAAMSHELRTPLNAIIGFSQILTNEKFGPLGSDSYKTFTADIEKCGQHLLSMINDILQVAKLEAGEVEVEAEEFEPKLMIEQCVARFAADIASARKVIRTTIPENITLRSDERLLRRAVLQLLSNAVKFTREGDVIEVKVLASETGGVDIEVSDSGDGVEQSHLSKLTHAFYQSDASLSRSHGGMGLGLYLVKRYVDLLAGDLNLESVKGAFFKARIELPPAALAHRRAAA
jgi:signal transduction histidine kinase